MQKEEKLVRGADLATTGQKIKSYVLEQITDKVSSDDIDNVVELTKAQYDALATKDARTMYIISDSAVDSDHVGIAKFEQTTKSTAPGGTNIWTVTLTNNQTFTLAVMNGTQGNSGYSGAAGELEVVNNVTQGGATAALSAEMGKQLEGEISQLGLKKTNEEETYKGGVQVTPIPLELGNISMAAGGNTYSASTTRVRMPEGTSVHLLAGDVIRLTDYTDARFYVNRTRNGSTWTPKGWNTSDFICPEEGDYIILLCNKTDTQQTDYTALGNLLQIIRNTTVGVRLSGIENVGYQFKQEYFKSTKLSTYVDLQNVNVGDTYTVTYVHGAPNYLYEIISVKEGDIVQFTTNTNTVRAKAYAILDAANKVLAIWQDSVTDMKLIMPSGAATFITNTKYASSVYLYRYWSDLYDKMARINKLTLDAIAKKITDGSVPNKGSTDFASTEVLAIKPSVVKVINTRPNSSNCVYRYGYGLTANTSDVGSISAFANWSGALSKKDIAKDIDDTIFDFTKMTSVVGIAFTIGELNLTTNEWSPLRYADFDGYEISLVGCTVNGSEIVREIAKSSSNDDKSNFYKAINHRGYSLVAPENTLPAYKLSKANGFGYVECDVQLTSDGVPVLLHDSTINRTGRNADGTSISSTVNIADITYAEALAYDFGIWKGDAYAGTKIPTLEEFISLCRNLGLRPYVEIKNDTSFTEAQVRHLVDIVEGYDMLGQTTWISFNINYLAFVHDYNAKARLGYVTSGVTATQVAAILALRSDNEIFIDDYYTINASQVSLCKSSNVPVEVWTVDSKADILGLNSYISGVTSDNLRADEIIYDSVMNS